MNRHLSMTIEHAADLLDALDLTCEVLRYASQELRHEIVDHYQPGTYDDLLDTVEHHASLLRAATSPAQPPAVTA